MRRFGTLLVLLVSMATTAGEASAQAPTYVGTFAMTNGASIECLTEGPPNGLGTANGITDPWAAVPSQEWAFLLLPNGFYAIFNVRSGDFLSGFDFSGGTPFDSAWTADPTQMWYLYPLGGQFYALVNVGTGYVLTDPSTGNQAGQFADTEPWRDTLDQWWYLTFLYE